MDISINEVGLPKIYRNKNIYKKEYFPVTLTYIPNVAISSVLSSDHRRYISKRSCSLLNKTL